MTKTTVVDDPQVQPDAPRRFLGRAEILATDGIEIREFYVPEWDAWVRVKGLTSAERDAFEDENTTVTGKSIEYNMANIRARLVARTVVDENGQRLFSKRDVEELGKKKASAINRIWGVARELSGMTDEDVQELAGKSVATPGDDFDSD